MRLIDIDKFKQDHFVELHTNYSDDYRKGLQAGLSIVNMTPVVDAVEVVRCKDCKKWEEDETYEISCDGKEIILWGVCTNVLHHCKGNHFCSFGVRKGIYND